MTVVLPFEDIEEHEIQSTTCRCNPSVMFENGTMIIVHNAFDGRQELEKMGIAPAEVKGWDVLQC